jgi:hypothetical protein
LYSSDDPALIGIGGTATATDRVAAAADEGFIGFQKTE